MPLQSQGTVNQNNSRRVLWKIPSVRNVTVRQKKSISMMAFYVRITIVTLHLLSVLSVSNALLFIEVVNLTTAVVAKQ